MKNKKVWFITGASRGMGVDITKAVLAAGHMVATGRNTDKVAKVLREAEDLLIAKLDVTKTANAEDGTIYIYVSLRAIVGRTKLKLLISDGS